MLVKDLLKKKILVWGYGLEGKNCVNFLLEKKYFDIILVATREEIDPSIKKENSNKIKFILEKDILNYDFELIIKSPSVSLYKEEIKELKKKNVIITSTLNIFLAEAQKQKENTKIITITGTKGKTTTCYICEHILKNFGYKIAFLGNVGVSFLSIIDNIHDYDYIILELSSYQVTDMMYEVDYSIILDLFPEHITWHLTHENYFNDKMKINNFSKCKIINFNDKIIQEHKNNEMDYLYFNEKKSFFLKNSFIYKNKKKLFNIKEISNIKGEHIFKNILSLFVIFDIEHIDLYEAFKCLKTFKTIEHRLEIFYNNEIKNIICIDDSISTIPEATIECLKTFKEYENLRLVLGGFDRQQNYDVLTDIINNHKNIKCYLIGKTAKKLSMVLENYEMFDNFDYLIQSITKDIEPNTAIILSPASCSFDMFKNFEERGNIFKKSVEKILNNAVFK